MTSESMDLGDEDGLSDPLSAVHGKAGSPNATSTVIRRNDCLPSTYRAGYGRLVLDRLHRIHKLKPLA